VFAGWMGGKSIEKALQILNKSGIPTYETPERAVRAFLYMVYARHGREFMGCKSPMCESCRCRKTLTQTLADGKGVSARKGLKEARVQNYEPTNRNSI
jgi:acyl-CoA synthetase (NDP forming)